MCAHPSNPTQQSQQYANIIYTKLYLTLSSDLKVFDVLILDYSTHLNLKKWIQFIEIHFNTDLQFGDSVLIYLFLIYPMIICQNQLM
jgi:hypothetical protein